MKKEFLNFLMNVGPMIQKGRASFDDIIKIFKRQFGRDPEGIEVVSIRKEFAKEPMGEVIDIKSKLPANAPYSDKNPGGWMPKDGEYGGLEALKGKIDELQEMGKEYEKTSPMDVFYDYFGIDKSKVKYPEKSKTPFTDAAQKMVGDVKLFGDETFEELQIIKQTGQHPRNKKAAGGRIGYGYGTGLKLAKLLKQEGVSLKNAIQESIDDFIQYSGDLKYDADAILDDMFERLAINRDAVDQKDVIDAYGKVYDTLSMNKMESMYERAADEALEGLGTGVKKTRNKNAGGGLNYLMGF
jgi:hypothetical protein